MVSSFGVVLQKGRRKAIRLRGCVLGPEGYDEDSVPSTVEQAAKIMAVEFDKARVVAAEENKEVVENPFLLHHTLGRFLRNNWSLWEPDTPIKRDAVTKYKIAHADDISGLILDWAMAIAKGEEFDPLVKCQQFEQHWAKFGLTALQAGGVKDEIL